MSRIANYASQQILNSYLQKVQERLNTTQVQITSEKKAQDYMGIGYDTQRLVGYEVNVQTLSKYKTNNDIQDIVLKSTEPALTGIETTISDFRKVMTSFNTQNVTDEDSVRIVQQQAFRSLQSMQSYLNTEVNGRFLFAGNRTTTAPVNLGLSTLEAFQAKYDGTNVTYPTTRDMHIESFDINEDSAGQANWLTFTQDADGSTLTPGTSTITATTAQFANVTVGSTIEVTGTASNNGTYQVSAISGGGTTLEVNTIMLTDEVATAAPTLTPTDGIALTSADFANLTFNRAGGTITSATGGALSGLLAGSSFTITGSAQNDGTYFVETAGATQIKIKESKFTDEGGAMPVNYGPAAPGLTLTANAGVNDDTIVGPVGTFTGAVAGMKMALTGTTGGLNDGVYTINTVSADGSTVTVDEVLPGGTQALAATLMAQVTSAAPVPTLTFGPGNLAFTQNLTAFDTITAAAGTFSNLSAAMKITTAGTVSNNGTYTIVSVSADGSSLEVLETLGTEAATGDEIATVPLADGTVKSVSYYQGDTFTRTHRVAKNREFTIDLNAQDPAFERAIRAMGLIAQGKFGTAGGLEQAANANRLTDAVNLVDLSLKANATTNPQYEVGYTNNIEQAFVTLGYQRSLIDDSNNMHTRLAGFFEDRVSSLENINSLDAITRLLDDQKSLEASYQAMATVRGLSLHNYLR